MAQEADIATSERLFQLLRHLDLDRVHLAGAAPQAAELAAANPEVVASVTVVCPAGGWLGPLRALVAQRTPAPPILIVQGDRGPLANAARQLAAGLPNARVLSLAEYAPLLWTDVLAERTAEVESALLALLAAAEARAPLAPAALPAMEGAVAGLTYRVLGSGPPLMLFPLHLMPSQWEPLLPALAARYTTITVGGAYLWLVNLIEQRASLGYGQVVDTLIDAMAPQPGETIVEVGCGSGPNLRRLARRIGGANRLVGVDINRFLVGEATSMARAEGLADAITFQEGNAEALPFADGSLDVAFSCTVLEEGDADRMLAELVRVVRSGGRVGVMVRAIDLPYWDSLAVRPEFRGKIAGRAGAGVAERGCADGSLYRRMTAAGLAPGWRGPQWGIEHPDPIAPDLHVDFEATSLSVLSPDEAAEWRAAAAQAEAAGAYIWGQSYHCAVGTKP